jgi:hypothetical protein
VTQPTSTARLVFHLARPYRGWFVTILLAMLVEAATGLAGPWPLKFVIDYAVGHQPVPHWRTRLLGPGLATDGAALAWCAAKPNRSIIPTMASSRGSASPRPIRSPEARIRGSSARYATGSRHPHSFVSRLACAEGARPEGNQHRAEATSDATWAHKSTNPAPRITMPRVMAMKCVAGRSFDANRKKAGKDAMRKHLPGEQERRPQDQLGALDRLHLHVAAGGDEQADREQGEQSRSTGPN